MFQAAIHCYERYWGTECVLAVRVEIISKIVKSSLPGFRYSRWSIRSQCCHKRHRISFHVENHGKNSTLIFNCFEVSQFATVSHYFYLKIKSRAFFTSRAFYRSTWWDLKIISRKHCIVPVIFKRWLQIFLWHTRVFDRKKSWTVFSAPIKNTYYVMTGTIGPIQTRLRQELAWRGV